MSEKSAESKLTFGRRTWNRENYTDEKILAEGKYASEDSKGNNYSTKITLPMDLDERIQRQYKLTGSRNKKQKILLKKKTASNKESDPENSLNFQCYVCDYKFNNDLKLIEHWNTEGHIEKLTEKEAIKFPVDYEEKYDKKRPILKQHLKYIQETKFKEQT